MQEPNWDSLPPLVSEPASEGGGDGWKVPDEDTYEFEFTKIIGTRMHAHFSKPDEPRPQVRLEFTIREDEEFDGVGIWRWFGWTVRPPNSALRPFLIAMRGGIEIPDGEHIELKDYVGKRFRATVTHSTSPSTRNPGQMVTFANIDSPIPLRKRRAKKPTEAPAYDTQEDEYEAEGANVFTAGVPA